MKAVITWKMFSLKFFHMFPTSFSWYLSVLKVEALKNLEINTAIEIEKSFHISQSLRSFRNRGLSFEETSNVSSFFVPHFNLSIIENCQREIWDFTWMNETLLSTPFDIFSGKWILVYPSVDDSVKYLKKCSTFSSNSFCRLGANKFENLDSSWKIHAMNNIYGFIGIAALNLWLCSIYMFVFLSRYSNKLSNTNSQTWKVVLKINTNFLEIFRISMNNFFSITIATMSFFAISRYQSILKMTMMNERDEIKSYFSSSTIRWHGKNGRILAQFFTAWFKAEKKVETCWKRNNFIARRFWKIWEEQRMEKREMRKLH